MKINKQLAWIIMLLIGAVSFGITSCSEDEDNSVNPVDIEEVEQAWFLTWYDFTPNGRVSYMEVYEELPETVDNSNAIEIGSGVPFTRTFNEAIYVINTDASTLTRWVVDKSSLELSVDGILSYASTGITGNREMIFVSETSAFLHDLSEGVIVEFNPTTMEITRTHNITPVVAPANFSLSINRGYLRGGKIIFPIRKYPTACCEYPEPVYATMGIFDPSSGSIEYIEDQRLAGIFDELAEDGNGNLYTQPFALISFIETFLDIDPSNFPGVLSILKVNDDGRFDPDFEIDLKELFPDMTIPLGSSFISQNQMSFTYSEHPVENDSWDDRFNFFGSTTKSVLIDLETLSITPFTAFDNFVLVSSTGEYDNTGYFIGYDRTTDPWSSHILRQNSATDYTTISFISGGEFSHTSKLW